jgi:hypothetical protein
MLFCGFKCSYPTENTLVHRALNRKAQRKKSAAKLLHAFAVRRALSRRQIFIAATLQKGMGE